MTWKPNLTGLTLHDNPSKVLTAGEVRAEMVKYDPADTITYAAEEFILHNFGHRSITMPSGTVKTLDNDEIIAVLRKAVELVETGWFDENCFSPDDDYYEYEGD